jgi:mono/diheme cytochrome c family protein
MGESGSVKMWILAFIVAAGVGFGTLLVVGCAQGANACPFTQQKPVTATDGPTLYQSLCIGCHGVGAIGTENGPSLVTGEPATFTLEQLKAKIARGKPLATMPMFKRELNQQQIDAVARYVLSLRGSS